MKYLIVLAGIIGLVVYIFLGGPRIAQDDAPETDRIDRVWDRIVALETQRQDLLVAAEYRFGDASPTQGLTRRGAYSAGYQAGFSQGYFEGSFLAGDRRPNSLFFPVPNP